MPASCGAGVRCGTATRTAAALLACCTMVAPAATAAADGPWTAFRVCRDPNNLPFQNVRGEGFEDRIAAVFANDLGVPLEHFDYPARFNFLRNTLRHKLPGNAYPCDIVMDVAVGFSQGTVSSRPYFRSTYAMVIPAASPLASVASVEEFLALPLEKLARKRVGLIDKSPASAWLAKRGLLDLGRPYPLLSADPDRTSAQPIEDDLVSGKLDAAIVWGPIAGHYARQHPEAQMKIIPMRSEPGIRFDFEIAMAVRIADRDRLVTLNGLIERHADDIATILGEYRVPLLAPLPPSAAVGDDD